jgi:hypothetical protein
MLTQHRPGLLKKHFVHNCAFFNESSDISLSSEKTFSSTHILYTVRTEINLTINCRIHFQISYFLLFLRPNIVISFNSFSNSIWSVKNFYKKIKLFYIAAGQHVVQLL